VADVGREEDVRNLIHAAVERFGRLDVLVNNAASWANDGRVTEIAEADWDATLASTLKSVFLCSKHAIPVMRAQGGGSIINIASINAVFGLALAAYTAAKGGVLALTRVMAVQHGAEGIRVNAISPGTIRTESWEPALRQNPRALEEWEARYPLRRVGEPEEVAALAAHLASDEARNTTGANFVMDGGLSAGLEIPGY
jgi:3-oxoacyl-[acyl-carrier protein] reductase